MFSFFTPELILGIISLIVVNVVSPIIGYQIAARKAKDDFHDKALQNRYNLVYTPLRNLLLETHITSSALLWPLSYRWEQSLSEIKQLRWRQALDIFLRSTVDMEHAVEYGKNFPLKKIKELVKKQGKWADAKLLDMVQAADRAQSQINQNSRPFPLPKEGYDLAIYIWDNYEKLNQRLLPR